MAWCVVKKPGSRLGPCAGCSHLDCQELRNLAASTCPGCKKPIGYEEPYTSDPFADRAASAGPGVDAHWWHFGCAQDAVEDQVKAMVRGALSHDPRARHAPGECSRCDKAPIAAGLP